MRPSLDRRLVWLIAVHLLLSAAPGLGVLVPSVLWYLPLLWVLASVNLAQLMLLGFWGGLGTNRLPVRIVGLVAGTAWVALLGPLLYEWLVTVPGEAPQSLWVDRIGAVFASFTVVVLLIAGVFTLVRRWSLELVHVDQPEPPGPYRFQFSILHLLVIATVVSLVLGLTRSARPAGTDSLSDWNSLALAALTLVMFAVNTVYAARATLGRGPVGYGIALVLLVAILLGINVSVVSGNGDQALAWWLNAGFTLASVLTTGLVLGSLLVVRRCGYRLVPRKAGISPER